MGNYLHPPYSCYPLLLLQFLDLLLRNFFILLNIVFLLQLYTFYIRFFIYLYHYVVITFIISIYLCSHCCWSDILNLLIFVYINLFNLYLISFRLILHDCYNNTSISINNIYTWSHLAIYSIDIIIHYTL